MFNWAKQQLANVAGTEEPIYGPSAIQTVTEQAKTTPYTELKKEHLRWKVQDSTNVETQQFYLLSEEGHIGLAQVIYSDVMGIRTAAQFNSKIIYPDGRPSLWCSTPLKNYGFSDDKYSFHADGCSLEFSEDGTYYTIKSATSNDCLVNLKVSRAAPGFIAGENGTTHFGTDPQKPWGSMWHKFWPVCEVEGSMITKSGEINFKGRGMYIHALQGMKPHHAGAKWNFVSFQGPDYSAVMMEFTTPASYGTTVVNVGGIAKKGEIIFAGASNTAKHVKSKVDDLNNWPEPSEVEYKWTGKTKDGKDATAVIAGNLGPRTDRVDVMAEVPAVIKSLLASAAGTKPYIYQFTPTLKLKMDIDGETIEQEGKLFIEATFIC